MKSHPTKHCRCHYCRVWLPRVTLVRASLHADAKALRAFERILRAWADMTDGVETAEVMVMESRGRIEELENRLALQEKALSA